MTDIFGGSYPQVGIKRLTQTAQLPQYAHDGDAGADLFADEDFDIFPQQKHLASTGLTMIIPDGYVGLIHPRSGLANKFMVTVLNAPGTIDSGYRGEVKVLLVNHGTETRNFYKGERIAQLVIQKVERAQFLSVEDYHSSDRGMGGFGSTGGHNGL